jgi:chromosome segregation ATPase
VKPYTKAQLVERRRAEAMQIVQDKLDDAVEDVHDLESQIEALKLELGQANAVIRAWEERWDALERRDPVASSFARFQLSLLKSGAGRI